jgi:hypothetical protein
MSITLGVFDIFTYAIPGSLYLTLLVFISARFEWIDPAKILHTNTTLVLIAAALACYLTGHISYFLGHATSRSVRVWRKNIEDARKKFVLRVPAAVGRPFVDADRSLLQAAVEIRQQDAALEIIRLRAIGLMLRNSAPAFVLGSMVAIGEIIVSKVPGFAVLCSAILLLAAVSSFWQATRLTHWANLKTFELAFWVPEIDDNLRSSGPS